jgi:hypothetical protein
LSAIQRWLPCLDKGARKCDNGLVLDQRRPTMALATMQKGNLDAAKADVHGKISKETVELEGVSVTRVTFGPGARWSTDLKPDAGTELCELPHVALVLMAGCTWRCKTGLLRSSAATTS